MCTILILRKDTFRFGQRSCRVLIRVVAFVHGCVCTRGERGEAAFDGDTRQPE